MKWVKPDHLDSKHFLSLLSESPNTNKVFVLAKIWGTLNKYGSSLPTASFYFDLN